MPNDPVADLGTARPAGPVELTELRVRALDQGALVELTASDSLVWAQYRDDDGDLIVELPNTLVAPTLDRSPQVSGALLDVTVESESGERPLTRLRIATVEPIEHALVEDGDGLRLEFFDGASPQLARRELAEPVRPAAASPSRPAVTAPAPTAASAGPASVTVVTAASAGTPEDPVEFVPATGFVADRLEGVELLADDGPSVRIRGNGEFEYSSFVLEDPDRFVLDLKGVVNRSARSTVTVAEGAVERVRLAQFRSDPDPVSRVVVDLRTPSLPSISHGPDGLVLNFGDDGDEGADGDAASELAAAPPLEVASSPAQNAPAEITAPSQSPDAHQTPAHETAVAATTTSDAAEAETAPQGEPLGAPVDDRVAAVEPFTAEPAPPSADEAAGDSAGGERLAESVSSPSVPAAVDGDSDQADEWTEPSPSAAAAATGGQEILVAETALARPTAESGAPPAAALSTGDDGGWQEANAIENAPPTARPRIVLREDPAEEPLRIDMASGAERPSYREPSDVSLFEAQDVRIETGGEPAAAETRQPAFGVRNLSNEREYFGEPVSLSLKDADITEVLRSFAQTFDLNIVIQPGVGGPVTVELNQVPWDQALDAILKVNGLGMDLDGSILRIAPVSRLQQEAENEQRLAQARALAVPLTTIMKRVSYATAPELASILTSGLRSGGVAGGRGQGILSPRGSVSVDRRTNTLIIQELPEYLDTVIQVIENLDTPTEQVMIEARIIETTRNFSRTLGIDWGFSGIASAATGNTTGLQFPNNINTDGGVQLLTGGANGFLNLGLGNVLNTFQLDIALQAAEAEGLINVISAPKISTLDNVGADIQTGLQIPIQTVANNTVSVQFVNATLRLSVTPQVTAEGTIQMDIQIQKREPQLAFAVVGATNAPIATREARTRVIVRDGGTAVIGGIYTVSNNQNTDKVPGLANIPVLGHLFKNRNRSNQNEELLIFITPRVIQL